MRALGRIGRRALGGLAAAAALTARGGVAAPVELRAADGLAVAGEWQEPAGRRRATLLLFHMAGSNLAEYAPIVPELLRRGFATLAIDQRSGGTLWGRRNATAAALPRDPGFAAAAADLAAALDWLRAGDPGGRVLLWGSSYSAALVFPLAAARPEAVAGLLAFSPGEYLQGVSVRAAAARVTCPVFVTSDADPAEEAAAAALLAAVRGAPRRQFRPREGAHGSAILRPDRNPRGVAAAWSAVGAFLDEVAPG